MMWYNQDYTPSSTYVYMYVITYTSFGPKYSISQYGENKGMMWCSNFCTKTL